MGSVAVYGSCWFAPAQAPGCSAGHLHFAHFPLHSRALPANLSCSGSQVLRKRTDSVRHALCVLPRSKQLVQPGAWWARCPRWAMCLNHLHSPTQSPRCTASVPSQGCHVSPLGSWSLAANLLADVNRPGSQEDVVSKWEPAHSLVEDARIWGRDWSSCLPSGSGCRSPASLPLAGWGACMQLATSPLVFAQFFVLWEGQAAH